MQQGKRMVKADMGNDLYQLIDLDHDDAAIPPEEAVEGVRLFGVSGREVGTDRNVRRSDSSKVHQE